MDGKEQPKNEISPKEDSRFLLFDLSLLSLAKHQIERKMSKICLHTKAQGSTPWQESVMRFWQSDLASQPSEWKRARRFNTAQIKDLSWGPYLDRFSKT